MKRDPSKPRYRAPEKPRRPSKKERPLKLLTPEKPHRAWVRLIVGLVLSTVIPYYALIYGLKALNPYRIFFDEKPSQVTLDGAAIALDPANGFDLSRFSFGDHRLRYVDARGKTREVELHPHLSDDDGTLSIEDAHLRGVPKAEFVDGS